MSEQSPFTHDVERHVMAGEPGGAWDYLSPVVLDSAGLRERVDKAIEDVLCEHRIVAIHGQPGERYVCEAEDCTYDTPDWTAWEEHVTPCVRDAILAVVGQCVTGEQRRIDDTPCPKCGGDRLRQDFTGSGRCHAPRPAPSTTTGGESDE